MTFEVLANFNADMSWLVVPLVPGTKQSKGKWNRKLYREHPERTCVMTLAELIRRAPEFAPFDVGVLLEYNDLILTDADIDAEARAEGNTARIELIDGPANLAAWEAEHPGALPVTWEDRSPGDPGRHDPGRHLLYRQNPAARLRGHWYPLPGVEIKCEGIMRITPDSVPVSGPDVMPVMMPAQTARMLAAMNTANRARAGSRGVGAGGGGAWTAPDVAALRREGFQACGGHGGVTSSCTRHDVTRDFIFTMARDGLALATALEWWHEAVTATAGPHPRWTDAWFTDEWQRCQDKLGDNGGEAPDGWTPPSGWGGQSAPPGWATGELDGTWQPGQGQQEGPGGQGHRESQNRRSDGESRESRARSKSSRSTSDISLLTSRKKILAKMRAEAHQDQLSADWRTAPKGTRYFYEGIMRTLADGHTVTVLDWSVESARRWGNGDQMLEWLTSERHPLLHVDKTTGVILAYGDRRRPKAEKYPGWAQACEQAGVSRPAKITARWCGEDLDKLVLELVRQLPQGSRPTYSAIARRLQCEAITRNQDAITAKMIGDSLRRLERDGELYQAESGRSYRKGHVWRWLPPRYEMGQAPPERQAEIEIERAARLERRRIAAQVRHLMKRVDWLRDPCEEMAGAGGMT